MNAGATVVVIDHDLDLLCACDYLIDLGPGAGPEGGRIVASGTPREVSVAPTSATGPWLADHRRAEWKSADNRVRFARPPTESGFAGKNINQGMSTSPCKVTDPRKLESAAIR
jgi:hypothetical protein